MDNKILDYLEKITDEEKSILCGKKFEKNIYTNKKDFKIVESCKLLKDGSQINIRTHTRFIDFAEHKHDYVEAIYVLKGSLTNIIDNEEIILKKGDLLFLNPHVAHSIKACNIHDIAINFIIKPAFFDTALSMLEEKNFIFNFLINTLRNNETNGQFLLFKTEGILPITNILENLIFSIISEKSFDEQNINKKLMGLLFMYLSNYTSLLTENSKINHDEVISKIIINYIETNYKTASLAELSEKLNNSVSQISRFIKNKFGKNFKELLQNKRFQIAIELLKNTNLSIYDIVLNVGYENNSYFHRKFKEIYQISPAEYRKLHNKIKK